MADTILVVGGDRAALKAAVKIRIQNPDKEVNVFIPSSVFPYRDFGIDELVRMGIRDFEVFKKRIIEYYKSQFNIKIYINCDVKSLLPDEKKIVVWDHKRNAEVHYKYGTLIVATGSVPIYPSVEGTNLNNVYFGDASDEAIDILKCIETGKVNQAVVIGGNISGIQTAQALWEKDILVTLIEENAYILPEFNMEIGEMVCKHLMEKGIEVITGQKVLTLIGNANGQVVEVHTLEHILTCQIVIWITERKPDIELAKAAGLIFENEVFVVNDHMETDIPGIYAVGNCASKEDLYAAELSIEVGKIFDLHIAKTGFSAQKAVRKGYKPESVLVAGIDEPMFSYVTEEMLGILVADRNTGRLLGAQFLGEAPVEKFADYVSALIAKDGTVDDLIKVSNCINYMEFMLLLSNAMADKLNNKYDVISPVSFYMVREDPNLIILDIRTEAEVTISKIPGAVNIPLEKLELRKEELDKEKTIVIVAKGYTQGQQAYGILFRNGFDKLKILEGGIAGYPYELE